MRIALLLPLLLLAGPVAADPSFTLKDATTIQVCWPGESGKQYGFFGSGDLENWTQIGEAISGIDGPMVAEDDISGASQKFYKVEELGGVVLDLSRFKFGTIGNSWTYDVAQDGLFGPEFFTWETSIFRRTTWGGEDVIDWEFKKNGSWDQSIYLLDDFTTGIFEVGGETVGGEQPVNTPPAPSLFASFTPGVGTETDYTSTPGLGEVDQMTTITIDETPLTVGAGTFTNLIKVTHVYTASLGGGVDGVTTEWFALDVGLVKHEASVGVQGIVLSTVFELAAYDVN